MVFLVDHDVPGVVGTTPALDVGVDLRVLGIGRIRRLPNRVFVQRERMVAGGHVAAAWMLVGPLG